MFIFPILKKNTFAEILYLKLDKFWKERLNSNEKWVYLHKSEPGTTINLKESVNATRIMSIHTSKGTGCEVVFVLGLSEHTLNIFSHKTDNITYNSLLHVAITRQKKAIYVGIENNNDEICRRFKKL
jgi:ATP-dependent exoDNAse (exonuclease V) beta subunit